MRIYCCGCRREVAAYLADGGDVYPNRKNLADRKFWVCPTEGCGAFVGTHWKTADPTAPLGTLATAEVRAMRQILHARLDPIWASGKVQRKRVYRALAHALGIREFHVAEVCDQGQFDAAMAVIAGMRDELGMAGPWDR
jgi:hypothetical protein